MTTKSRSALQTQIAADLGDNTIGGITPEDLRQVCEDIVDSMNAIQDADAGVFTTGSFSGVLIVTGPFSAPAPGEGALSGTAALGLVLFGQGATNDITAADKSGNTAWRIPTGTVNTLFEGAILSTGGSFAAPSTGTSIYISGATDGFVASGHGSTNDVVLANQNGATALRVIQNSTNVDVVGTFTAGTKTFRIPHPIAKGKDLVHACIEGPKADLIYRGTVTLSDGSAQIDINEVSRMTAGTFEALCRDIQCMTTNESGSVNPHGMVEGGILTIMGEGSDVINWLVIAERNDDVFLNSDMTNGQGQVIVEPEAWERKTHLE